MSNKEMVCGIVLTCLIVATMVTQAFFPSPNMRGGQKAEAPETLTVLPGMVFVRELPADEPYYEARVVLFKQTLEKDIVSVVKRKAMCLNGTLYVQGHKDDGACLSVTHKDLTPIYCWPTPKEEGV